VAAASSSPPGSQLPALPPATALAASSSASAGDAVPASLAPVELPAAPPVVLPTPILEDAEEWWSGDSGSECETDSSEDELHGYHLPVPRGDALRVYLHEDGTWGCPVCPGKAHNWETPEAIHDHVMGQTQSPSLREWYKKKWSHHRVLARNHGWMPQPEQVQD
jgi:hypothetical protein